MNSHQSTPNKRDAYLVAANELQAPYEIPVGLVYFEGSWGPHLVESEEEATWCENLPVDELDEHLATHNRCGQLPFSKRPVTSEHVYFGGPPKATEHFSSNRLMEKGIVGIWRRRISKAK